MELVRSCFSLVAVGVFVGLVLMLPPWAMLLLLVAVACCRP